MTVIGRYFTQLDLAMENEEAFSGLEGLFSEDASLRLKGYDEVRGRGKIREFFQALLGKNREMKHVWEIAPERGGFRVPWAAACVSKAGDVFTMEGTDHIVLDADGKIQSLFLGIGTEA
ncbi:nuclear transport factor 2 family protein [Caproiciproducens sp.]